MIGFKNLVTKSNFIILQIKIQLLMESDNKHVSRGRGKVKWKVPEKNSSRGRGGGKMVWGGACQVGQVGGPNTTTNESQKVDSMMKSLKFTSGEEENKTTFMLPQPQECLVREEVVENLNNII